MNEITQGPLFLRAFGTQKLFFVVKKNPLSMLLIRPFF